MEQLHESPSMQFDHSFFIEKEISRHFLYDAAENIIEILIKNNETQVDIFDALSFWFQNISNQLVCELQMFYVINKIPNNNNNKDTHIDRLIEELADGYETIYYIKKRITYYQKHKKLFCNYLIFVLSGIEKSYSDYLSSLNYDAN